MKCPKCGYLGFETSDRCRNCGYDFSLTQDVAPASELPLHSAVGAGEPLADFEFGERAPAAREEPAEGLDLDRIIGAPETDTRTRRKAMERSRAATPTPSSLPLFNDGDDDTPLITTPRPLRAPLSVRRTTPEIPRTRARTVTPRHDEGELAFPSEGAADAPALVPERSQVRAAPADHRAPAVSIPPSASAARRLGAAVVDLALLGSIDVAVVYLTLALAGLTMDQVTMLPLAPIITFLALLDGGYIVAFIAASGQTVGKMLTGIRVIADDGRRVDIGAAIIRAVGCGASLMTAGIGYLPAFLGADRRALQDRISRTRVVSAR